MNPILKAMKENVLEMQAIEQFNIVMLSKPILVNGKTYNAAKLHRQTIVRDRINASYWCNKELGFECHDGVVAGIASSVLHFGTLNVQRSEIAINHDSKMIETSLELNEPEQLAPDHLVDNLLYDDFTWLAVLVGKKTPLLA